MELIIRHVAAKREQGTLELDWPVRKKWLERICKLALRMRTPQVRQRVNGPMGQWINGSAGQRFSGSMVQQVNESTGQQVCEPGGA